MFDEEEELDVVACFRLQAEKMQTSARMCDLYSTNMTWPTSANGDGDAGVCVCVCVSRCHVFILWDVQPIGSPHELQYRFLLFSLSGTVVFYLGKYSQTLFSVCSCEQWI